MKVLTSILTKGWVTTNALVEVAQGMYNAYAKSEDFNTVSDYDLQRIHMPF